MLWDLFCRVIDNHGDLGVCWRLAADLAGRGERVRLWVDDPSALAWMAPAGAAQVQVLHWTDGAPDLEPGEVVVEAFGCDPPQPFVHRMAARAVAPVWINLEYLSAEGYVERSHGLASPQLSGAGAGLTKWFFYPGFSARTAGLLREPDLAVRQARFDAKAWRREQGLPPGSGEQVVSLFCYANAAIGALLDRLAERPTLLLLTPGPATAQVEALLGPTLTRGPLRAHKLNYLSQYDYDHLLWASDLNFVRGEDSFVRAQWAGRPFVWQIYPQQDAAHAAKLDAFLERFTAGAEPALADALHRLFHGWNDLGASDWQLPPAGPWGTHARHWRSTLSAQADLGTQLLGFVAQKR